MSYGMNPTTSHRQSSEDKQAVSARPSPIINSATIPSLEPHAVHIWKIPLDVPVAVVQQLETWLAPSELDRAGRFVQEIDRLRFIVSHAAVREILAHYLEVEPAAIEMNVRTGGKPELADSHRSDLQFNLSHSGALGMVAVTSHDEVGIDVEQVRSNFDAASIVTRFFSQREIQRWQQLPGEEKLPAFFRCWTRKEAYLKARGLGLSLELDQFDVAFGPGQPAQLLSSRDATDNDTTRWAIHDVSPNEEYIAACVVEQEIESLLTFEWAVA